MIDALSVSDAVGAFPNAVRDTINSKGFSLVLRQALFAAGLGVAGGWGSLWGGLWFAGWLDRRSANPPTASIYRAMRGAVSVDPRDERIASLEALGRAMVDEYGRDDQCDYVRINRLIENIHAVTEGAPLPYPAALSRQKEG